MLNKSFTGKLRRSSNKGGWTYLIWPDSVTFLELVVWLKSGKSVAQLFQVGRYVLR